MSQVNLNIDELKDVLKHTIENNRYLQKNGKVPLAINIESEAGIGKTSAVHQLAEEMGLKVVRINLAEIEEIGDLTGFPIRQFQLCKEENCIWIDEHAIDSYTKQGYSFTGQKRMSYCPPEWISNASEGLVLLLDDYTRGDSRFMQATMTLIDKQKYISWELPKDSHIILTTNPDSDYMITSLDNAQKTRFSTVHLKFDINCWMRYAEKEGVDTRAINFLGLHPELVTDKCNARSITNFFNSISSFESFEKNLAMIQNLGEGAVGPEFTTLFVLFVNNKLDRIINPFEIFNRPEWESVQNSLRTCIGKDDNYRADIASILTTRIINYSTVYAEKHTVSKEMINRLISITTDDIFGNDLKYYVVKSILNANKTKFAPIMLNEKVVQMAVK